MSILPEQSLNCEDNQKDLEKNDEKTILEDYLGKASSYIISNDARPEGYERITCSEDAYISKADKYNINDCELIEIRQNSAGFVFFCSQLAASIMIVSEARKCIAGLLAPLLYSKKDSQKIIESNTNIWTLFSFIDLVIVIYGAVVANSVMVYSNGASELLLNCLSVTVAFSLDDYIYNIAEIGAVRCKTTEELRKHCIVRLEVLMRTLVVPMVIICIVVTYITRSDKLEKRLNDKDLSYCD